jgi:hypothetical protein
MRHIYRERLFQVKDFANGKDRGAKNTTNGSWWMVQIQPTQLRFHTLTRRE